MAVLMIDDDVAQELRDIAVRENLSESDLLRVMLGYYLRRTLPDPAALEAFLSMDGMFDDDITDLSSMTKEDVMDAYRKKYGDSS